MSIEELFEKLSDIKDWVICSDEQPRVCYKQQGSIRSLKIFSICRCSAQELSSLVFEDIKARATSATEMVEMKEGIFLCSCVAVAPASPSAAQAPSLRGGVMIRALPSKDGQSECEVHQLTDVGANTAITPAWLMDYTLQLTTPWVHLLPNPPSAADIKIQGLLCLGRVKAAMALLKCSPPDSVSEALANKVQASHARVQQFLDLNDSSKGWTLCYDNGFQVYYKCEGSVHSAKMCAQYESSVLELLSLAREFDLVQNWGKMTKYSALLEESHMLSTCVYLHAMVPWPVTDRDLVVRADAFDLLTEDGLLVVLMESIDDAPFTSQLADTEYKSNVRALLTRSGIRIRPLPDGPDGKPRCEACMITNMDPQMTVTPSWLIKFVLGVGAPWAYSSMCGLLKSIQQPDSEHRKRILKRQTLYGLVQVRVDEFIAQSQTADAEGKVAESASGCES